MNARPFITRFAPAPTGYLHLGHVVNAVHVWGVAQAGGPDPRVLLRIEDHDRLRSRTEFESAIVEDLEWLGFIADRRRESFTRQRERGAYYEAALEQLRPQGVVYACDCSRSAIAASSGLAENAEGGPASERRYPGTCSRKALPESAGVGIRVRLAPSIERFDDFRHGPQEQRPHEQCGDLLVRDRDGHWTYQFAVVVDDWLQAVSVVIRGDDLLASTGRQIQLARMLGREVPPSFFHHPLVMKSATHKLSKSDHDTGVRELRARGVSARQVIGQAAHLAGLVDQPREIDVGEVGELLEKAYGPLSRLVTTR